MKKIALLSLSVLVLAACNKPQEEPVTENKEIQVEEPVIGGEKDDHGCISAAGESWSELKNACVQIFEVGQRLNPVEVKEGETVLSAFALFNEDKSKVELFVPTDDKKSIILDKSEADVYQNDTYKFDATTSALFINGEKKFEAEK